MPAPLVEQLLGWIQAQRPARLFLVASPGHPLEAALDQMQPSPATTRLAPAQAAAGEGLGSTVYDLAIVCDALETQSRRDLQRLMSRLRDVQARAVICTAAPPSTDTPATDLWTSTDFIALGFKRCRTIESANGWQVYRFDIHDYKDTPPWLNPRHWANPEQWDRHRW